MNIENIIIRQMTIEDVNECLEIWRQIGLVEGRKTLLCSMAADPQGFMVAENVIDQDGNKPRILGVCAGVKISSEDAFMGFYAVRPEYQGLGIGSRIWKATTARLNGINIGLYSVGKMNQKYIDCGFVVTDPVKLCIFDTIKSPSELKLDSLNSISEFNCNVEITDLGRSGVPSDEIFQKLSDFDYGITGTRRDQLLHYYLCGNDCPITIVAFEKGSTNNEESCCRSDSEFTSKVVAYACMREENAGGFMLGPLYAETPKLAEGVLKYILSKYDRRDSGTHLSAMCLSNNREIIDTLNRVGFHEDVNEQCSRLYTNRVIEAPNVQKIHLIFSPNFTAF